MDAIENFGQYDALFHDFDSISRYMANIMVPQGYRPSAVDAPNDYEALKAQAAQGGKLLVSADFSTNTIYDDPEGNFAFRAWHDATHLKLGNAGFDRAGEVRVFRQQCADMLATWPDFIPFRREHFAAMVNIIRCEIVGQFDYNDRTGGYPQYQRQFTIDYMNGVE